MTAPNPGDGGPIASTDGRPTTQPDQRPDSPTEPLSHADQGNAQRRQFGMAIRFCAWLAAGLEVWGGSIPGHLGVRVRPTPDSASWPVVEVRTREGIFTLTVAYHEGPTRFSGRARSRPDGGVDGA